MIKMSMLNVFLAANLMCHLKTKMGKCKNTMNLRIKKKLIKNTYKFIYFLIKNLIIYTIFNLIRQSFKKYSMNMIYDF